MADYKELLGALVSKARSAMDSSGVTEVYQKGAGRAKIYSRIARLTLDMNGQAEELRKVYTEIGKLYFEQARQNPEGFFAPLFAQAETLFGELEAKEKELAALKDSLKAAEAEKDIEVEITEEPAGAEADFDAVVDATESEGRGSEE